MKQNEAKEERRKIRIIARIHTHTRTLCMLPSHEFNLLNGITCVINAGAKGTRVQTKKNHPVKGKEKNTHTHTQETQQSTEHRTMVNKKCAHSLLVLENARSSRLTTKQASKQANNFSVHCSLHMGSLFVCVCVRALTVYISLCVCVHVYLTSMR